MLRQFAVAFVAAVLLGTGVFAVARLTAGPEPGPWVYDVRRVPLGSDGAVWAECVMASRPSTGDRIGQGCYVRGGDLDSSG